MQLNGHQRLDPRELKVRELADEWARVYRQYQQAAYSIEEELLFEEAQDIKKEAKRRGLTDRINELLRERKFGGEMLV
jgi:hypothetical protein